MTPAGLSKIQHVQPQTRLYGPGHSLVLGLLGMVPYGMAKLLGIMQLRIIPDHLFYPRQFNNSTALSKRQLNTINIANVMVMVIVHDKLEIRIHVF